MSVYKSRFAPSPLALKVMNTGRIIGADEAPAAMVERVTDALYREELTYSTITESEEFAEAFGQALDNKEIIMSTPVMTNIGRYADRPLTACTMPAFDFSTLRLKQLRQNIIALHEQGMGTGFNLNETDDPVSALDFLNKVAIDSANSGREDRPVGNMAILGVRHPQIYNFVNAKVESAAEWKFNISVDIDRAFMTAVEAGSVVHLDNGQTIKARVLFDQICRAALLCADPGIVFLDRMNARNPVPGLGAYQTTAPCAEVGLIPGETCQFGYINVGEFVYTSDTGRVAVNLPWLEHTTKILTRALDNCLEISGKNFAKTHSGHVLAQKRKIGIGLCGVADALDFVGLAYDSDAARSLMEDILSFINITSKEESIRLAEQRGPFGAMLTTIAGNRHRENPGHIQRMYGHLESSTVSGHDWCELSRYVADTGMLRNVSTIALPPTGRSALIIDASTGIEPHFKDATRISVSGHIGMASALQRYTDEAISKTINLPSCSTVDDVRTVYLAGYEAGLSGVTVYVNGTNPAQPKELTHNDRKVAS
ncbi:hypothetical protein [Nocardia miyunensis]|uniref:hypothetical protein n=1 Tax=Nocardia miyunensis TaxID=282684 RepID=UPI0009FF92E3|nr:hypothetical protein [Nocardia miyunensis]